MTAIDKLADKLKGQCPHMELRRKEPMSAHSSFRIGGRVSAMAMPCSEDELCACLRAAADAGVEPLVIGNGTNLLVRDGELDIFVIKTFEGVGSIELEGEDRIRAGAGALLSRVAPSALKWGLSGMEVAQGIPGSLGGAVYMNAGAYGGEMKDIVSSVRWTDRGLELRETSGADCDFRYRGSRFSDEGGTVLSAEIKLEKGDPEAIRAKMDELAAKRRASQPLNFPSAGSTFKRPAQGFAAALIDQAGLKGKGFGGAKVSEKHAGFIINAGGATFDDVIKTMDYVKEQVFRHSGIELEPEVKIIR